MSSQKLVLPAIFDRKALIELSKSAGYNNRHMIKVTAAIIVENSKLLIAKRKPPVRMPGMWEFPGGKIEDGETPEKCLQKELHEELEIKGSYSQGCVQHSWRKNYVRYSNL